jgi:hypothetical protein
MINIVDYDKVYRAAFPFLNKLKITSLPVSTDEITSYLGIETKPLSEYISEGFECDDIFRIWGNRDGVALQYNGKTVIAYNDYKIVQRQRFTIAEECSHVLLGHLENREFNIFNQSYSYDLYEQFEEEARACAGLLLFPPSFYYNHLEYGSIEEIAARCDISLKCAETRVDIYNKHRTYIIYNINKYGLQMYKPQAHFEFTPATVGF